MNTQCAPNGKSGQEVNTCWSRFRVLCSAFDLSFVPIHHAVLLLGGILNAVSSRRGSAPVMRLLLQSLLIRLHEAGEASSQRHCIHPEVAHVEAKFTRFPTADDGLIPTYEAPQASPVRIPAFSRVSRKSSTNTSYSGVWVDFRSIGPAFLGSRLPMLILPWLQCKNCMDVADGRIRLLEG